jgi:CpeT protein
MLETFVEYFEGYFDNQRQAFQYPQDFALIALNHKSIEENKFKVTQGYTYEPEPYRTTIIEVCQDNDLIITKNYKESESGLTYLDGCDTIFEWNGTTFHGKSCCETCYVHKDGRDTFLLTESFLSENHYRVIDKGYDVNTKEHVWGSFTNVNGGFFEFDRK